MLYTGSPRVSAFRGRASTRSLHPGSGVDSISASFASAKFALRANPSASYHLMPHPQGREARRPAGGALNQIRVRHQPANGARARHRGARQGCSPSPTRWST